MQTGRTRTIGVMIPPFDSFWVDVLAGIHIALASADYLPITVWVGDCSGDPPLRERRRRRLQARSAACSTAASTD